MFSCVNYKPNKQIKMKIKKLNKLIKKEVQKQLSIYGVSKS